MDKQKTTWTFKLILKRFVKEYKPEKIIEWGPGISTKIMVKSLDNPEIHSFEHNKEWYNRWKKDKDFESVHVYYTPLGESYISEPLKMFSSGYFDFAFIDGRERVRCMEVAKILLKDGGFVMLHDAQRARYKDGINLFKPVGFLEIFLRILPLPFSLKRGLFLFHGKTFLGKKG